MTIINTSKVDTFDAWRIKTNTTAAQLGDNTKLLDNNTLTTNTAVDAIIEVLTKVEREIGTIGALTTSSTKLVNAINEHDSEIGVLKEVLGGVDENGDPIVIHPGLSTQHTDTLVGAINEVRLRLDTELGAISELTTTEKSNVVDAINELDAEIGVMKLVVDGVDEEGNPIVIHPGLSTEHTDTLVGSINEIFAREQSRYDNTLKLDLTHETVGSTNDIEQEILSNLKLPEGKTFTINGSLDISEGSLTVGGGDNSKLNINTTYIGLGDVNSTVAPKGGGLIINRGKEDTVLRSDVRVYWDGTDYKWRVKRVYVDADTLLEVAITPYLLDNNNFADVISGGSQSGITVTYQNDNTLDFDVNDFKITLTGDVAGEATVTNLGDVSIETTVQLDKVALGTDTTGAYVKSITLATDSGLSITESASDDESNALTEVKVDSTVVRTTGAQTLEGVKTFSDKPVFNAGITVGDASADTSSFKGDVTFDNNVEVKGNLVVSGTTTTVNSSEVNLADNILLLNSDFSGWADKTKPGEGDYTAASENVGIKVNRGLTDVSPFVNVAQPEFVWNEADDVWKINDGSSTYTLVGSIKVDDATLSARTITTTANSKEITTNNYAGIAVGDTVTSVNIPAGTFVTSIDGTTKLTLSQAATASGTNTAATFEHVAGMNVSSSGHVTTLEHYTPSSVALDSNNSGGTVLQDVYFDQFGHVKSIGTYDLDNRYYTESESDNRFVNVSGDTMTGNLTMQYYGTTTSPGFTNTYTGDNNTKRYLLTHYLDNKDKILSVKVAGTDVDAGLYSVSGRFLTLTNAPTNGQVVEINGKAPRVVFGRLVGNAETADESLKWSTARKITLSGNASGSVSFDGSSDVTMEVTVGAGSHQHTAANVTDFGAAVSTRIGTMLTIGSAEYPKATFNGISVSVTEKTDSAGVTDKYFAFDVNDFKIKLSGLVTGEGTVSNLGNVTIATTVNDADLDLIAAIKKQMPKIYNASGVQIFPTN